MPLEALRIGCDAFSSDLNPVAEVIERVILEHIPRFGTELAVELRTWGEWIKAAAADELAEYFRSPIQDEVPIAYLWARTVLSEAPGSSIPIEVPLIRTMWLAKKGELKALRWVRDRNNVVETETVTILLLKRRSAHSTATFVGGLQAKSWTAARCGDRSWNVSDMSRNGVHYSR